MPKFIPLTMLKDTTGIVDYCQECGEPVFVTRNGTPELVIMDSEFFDKYLRYRDSSGKLDIQREFAQIPETITTKKLKNTGEVSAHCTATHGPVSIIRKLSALRAIASGMQPYGNRLHYITVWIIMNNSVNTSASRPAWCARQ